jgi:hypothetical protein
MPLLIARRGFHQQTLLIVAGCRQETACLLPGWNWHLARQIIKKTCRRLPWFRRASPSTTLNEIRYINEYG